MKINRIKLKNFRGFESFSARFNNRLTVIVGNNGAGKSSLLDAVSIAVGTFLTGFDATVASSISKDDATIKCYDMGSVIDAQHQFPVCIAAEGEIGDQVISWKRELNSAEGRTTIVGAKELIAISENYQKKIREGSKETILPLISYYGTGRLWAQKKEKRPNEQLAKFSRQMGYTDCLAAESNEKLMLKWFEKMTIQEAQSKTASPEFSAVKQAITACFEGITGYKDIETQYNLDTHAIDVVFTDDYGIRKRFQTKDLSDGYKNTLSMIGDIAYRMAVLNPQLLNDVLTKTPGIVLIDEIDLHLHPIWQQRILGDIQRIFPKIQLIVTTHAPAVISSVKQENLLLLSDNGYPVSPSTETYGSDANSILTSIMNATERPVEIKRMFESFYNAIDNEEFESARALLRRIEDEIGPEDTELVSAHVTLDLAEI